MQLSKRWDIPQQNRTDIECEIRRREFITAVSKLEDDDSWKKAVMANLDLTKWDQTTPQMWTSKAMKENFQRWLAAPESGAPFDFIKIFKTLGYSIDLTQRDLAPAVPFMLALRVIAEAKDMQQVKRTTRWFLKVGEEGFRFKQSNQLLEFIRRAMELRRTAGASWEG